MPDTINARQAAELVGISHKTILRYCAAGAVTGARKVSPRGAAAHWEIPITALDELKRTHRAHIAVTAPPASGDLEARVADIEAQLAALRRRAPWLFTEDAASPSAAPVAPAIPRASAHVWPRREVAPASPPVGKPPMPDGWVSFNAWCLLHGVNRRAAAQEVTSGQLPAPERGEWWQRPQEATRSAYSVEQHIAASRFAALRWSARFTACDVCRPHLATLPGRATAPTVPIGAQRIQDDAGGDRGDT